jgi:hypothetical protein
MGNHSHRIRLRHAKVRSSRAMHQDINTEDARAENQPDRRLAGASNIWRRMTDLFEKMALLPDVG